MDINRDQPLNLSIIDDMCIDEYDIFKSMDMMIDIAVSNQIQKIIMIPKKQKSKKIQDLPEIIEEPEPIILTPIIQDEDEDEDEDEE